MSTFMSGSYKKGRNEVMDAIEAGSGFRVWGELLRTAIRDKLGNDYYLGMWQAMDHYTMDGTIRRK